MTDKRRSIIQRFFEDMNMDMVEERIIKYITRELHMGRKLSDVMQDPYIKNRIDNNRLDKMLENEEIISAVEEELAEAFKSRDFKFAE